MKACAALMTPPFLSMLKPFGASGVLVDAFFRDRLKLAWTPDIIAE
jgi:hypothetical protein